MTRLVERRNYPWLCWGLVAFLYFLQNGLLIFPEAIYAELQRDLNVDSTQIGFISASFLYSWALMQIPAGLMLDRFNTRYLLFFATIIMAMGCLMMSLADSYWMSLLARLMMGAGGGFAFIAALYMGQAWFLVVMFPLIVGLTEMQSGLGAIAFQALFGALKAQYDWRLLVAVVGFFVLITAFFIFTYVRDKAPESRKEKVNVWEDFRSSLSNKRLWLLALFAGFAYAHFEAMTDMWGVHFLQVHYHLTEFYAILLNSVVIVGYTMGCPLFGFLTRHFHPRRLMLTAAIIEVICLYLITYVWMNLWVGAVVLFILGFVTAASLLSFDLAKLVVPKRSYGMAAGFINTWFGIIGMLLIPVVGYTLNSSASIINGPVVIFFSGAAMLVFAIVINIRHDFHLHEEVFAAHH